MAPIDKQADAAALVTAQPFGRLRDGTSVQLFTMRSDAVECSITNYGGRIVALLTPDREGNWDDITLGFASLEPYTSERWSAGVPTALRTAGSVCSAALTSYPGTMVIIHFTAVRSASTSGSGMLESNGRVCCSRM